MQISALGTTSKTTTKGKTKVLRGKKKTGLVSFHTFFFNNEAVIIGLLS